MGPHFGLYSYQLGTSRNTLKSAEEERKKQPRGLLAYWEISQMAIGQLTGSLK